MKMITTLGDRRVAGYDYPIAAERSRASRWSACWVSSPRRDAQGDVAKVQADTAKVLAVPETRKRIEDLGMEVVTTRPEAVRSADPERNAALVTRHQRSQN